MPVFQFMPTDIEAVAAALKTVLYNPKSAEVMRRNGLERARTFSWERCAQETLEIYSAVMVKGRGASS